MKFTEKWLSEFTGSKIDRKVVLETLTSLGLETHLLKKRKFLCSKVFLGKIIAKKAENINGKYSVYEAKISASQNINVFTKLRNIIQGTCVPIIISGGYTKKIENFLCEAIGGILCSGMICSRYDLGIDNIDSNDTIIFPKNSPIGADFSEYFFEHDRMFDTEVTHNRPDCNSIFGLAREICIAKKMPIKHPIMPDFTQNKEWKIPVRIKDPSLCRKYVGRVIRGINLKRDIPLWIKERLIYNNIFFTNSINDIINYVALEIGQVVNFFNLDAVKNGIEVRRSIVGEKILIGEKKELHLNPGTTIVSNFSHPISIAGVTNCFSAKIKKESSDIFIESATFNLKDIKSSSNFYCINNKIDRVLDNTSQEFAIEYATSIILTIFGGYPGTVCGEKVLEKNKEVEFQTEKINSVLGTKLTEKEILCVLRDSGIEVVHKSSRFFAVVPNYRMDLNCEIDIVEEVARIYGYENIPKSSLVRQNEVKKQNKNQFSLSNIAGFLSARGYHEVFNYSFYANTLKEKPEQDIVLSNPMNSDMSVMRSDLIQGLLKNAQYNNNRSCNRLRLFEIGSVFHKKHGNYIQTQKIGVLSSGSIFSEQWCAEKRKIDFYDAKLELECLFGKVGFLDKVTFQKVNSNTFFDSNESANIFIENKKIGVIGLIQDKFLKSMKNLL